MSEEASQENPPLLKRVKLYMILNTAEANVSRELHRDLFPQGPPDGGGNTFVQLPEDFILKYLEKIGSYGLVGKGDQLVIRETKEHITFSVMSVEPNVLPEKWMLTEETMVEQATDPPHDQIAEIKLAPSIQKTVEQLLQGRGKVLTSSLYRSLRFLLRLTGHTPLPSIPDSAWERVHSIGTKLRLAPNFDSVFQGEVISNCQAGAKPSVLTLTGPGYGDMQIPFISTLNDILPVHSTWSGPALSLNTTITASTTQCPRKTVYSLFTGSDDEEIAEDHEVVRLVVVRDCHLLTADAAGVLFDVLWSSVQVPLLVVLTFESVVHVPRGQHLSNSSGASTFPLTPLFPLGVKRYFLEKWDYDHAWKLEQHGDCDDSLYLDLYSWIRGLEPGKDYPILVLVEKENILYQWDHVSHTWEGRAVQTCCQGRDALDMISQCMSASLYSVQPHNVAHGRERLPLAATWPGPHYRPVYCLETAREYACEVRSQGDPRMFVLDLDVMPGFSLSESSSFLLSVLPAFHREHELVLFQTSHRAVAKELCSQLGDLLD